jgi:hypothetical protein
MPLLLPILLLSFELPHVLFLVGNPSDGFTFLLGNEFIISSCPAVHFFFFPNGQSVFPWDAILITVFLDHFLWVMPPKYLFFEVV